MKKLSQKRFKLGDYYLGYQYVEVWVDPQNYGGSFDAPDEKGALQTMTIGIAEKDYGGALADIQQVLGREPRHFGALSGLGVIMQELGEDKLALEAFRRALAVNPHLQKVPDFVKTLTEKVEGRDI